LSKKNDSDRETDDRGQETDDRGQGSGVRGQGTDDRGQGSGVRGQGTKDAKAKGQKSRSKSKGQEAETADASDATTDSCDTDNVGAEPEEAAQEMLLAERDRYLRLAAEFDNFRKRKKIEYEASYSNARADTITRLLPVYDNLERALKMECADEAFYKGVEMTMTGLKEILEGMDVSIIEAVGETFDPNRHNAVMSIENPELGEKTVAEEFQKGFMLGDRVIRFSTVVVAN